MEQIKKLFLAHPNDVGMSYIGHFFYALSVMARLLICVPACLIHAFFPFLFTNTTSKIVNKLHDEFNHRISTNGK